MKKSTLWISMIAALALGSAGAVGTGAGTVITNIAQVTYPDPDGGPTVTANSNTLTATVTPVPSLSIVQNGGLVQGGSPNTVLIGAGYTGPVAPGQKVAVLYTLTNTSNVDDRYTLTNDFDNTAVIPPLFYPYSALSATPTQTDINTLSSGNITSLGSESNNTAVIPHISGNTSRFWVVYTVPTSGIVQIGPVGTSVVSSSAGSFTTDPDGAGPLASTPVIGTNSPVFDGHTGAGTTTATLQGSQNLHTFTIASGVISGRVINDLSNDATNNTTEPGIAGVTLTLQQETATPGSFANYTPPGASGPTTVTNSTGDYSFGNLPAGTYRVLEGTVAGYVDGTEYPGTGGATSPLNDVIQVTLAANATSSGNIFGERGTAISGTVFWDQNADGSNAADPADPGINGVTVFIDSNNNVSFDVGEPTTTTTSTGAYTFGNLPAGSYVVRETQPSGYGSSTPNSFTVTLVAGTPGSANFGDTLSTLSGQVYDDVNNNALFDVVGDTGISGVTLALFASDGTTAIVNPVTGLAITTTTIANGTYTLQGIPAGSGYVLKETQPSGYVTRASNPGTVGGFASGTGNTIAGNALTNQISAINLPLTGTTPPGSSIGINYNFGEQRAADLSLTKAVAPRNAQPGDTVTFTLTVTNAGPGATANVVVSDVVPAGYTNLAENDADASFTVNTLTWNVGTLAVSIPTNTKTLTFTAVVAPTPAAGTLRNLAEITVSGQPDPDSTPGNAGTTPGEDDTGIAELGGVVLQKLQRNLGPATNPTNPVPALSVATIVGKPLDVVEYCINATNLNSRSINGINLSDVVPANTTYVTSSGGTLNVNKVDFTAFNLTSGASQQNCFKVTIN